MQRCLLQCISPQVTPMMRNSSEIFYARGGRMSFHTTKTLNRHKREYFAATHSALRAQ